MRPHGSWFTRRPFVADAGLALTLFVLEVVGAASIDASGGYVAVCAAVCAPLIWRRRYPVIAAWATLALCQVGSILVETGASADFPPGRVGLLVLLYTLVMHTRRRDTVIFAAGLVADLAIIVTVLGGNMVTAGFILLMYALAWITAEYLRARRDYVEEVKARLAVAEQDRDRRAVDAVNAERTRIARELHDVVAHAVSVMIVQADGASYTLRTDVDRTDAALGNISATGRRALAELRRTVSLLRTEESTGLSAQLGADGLPQYGTAALAKVVETMRMAGLRVEIEQTGDLDDLSPAVSLGIHRLVQESLTNVLRHGGDQPRAWVVVRRDAPPIDESVLVQVTNSTGTASGSTATLEGSGFGVIGMRERVAVLGGELSAGRLPDGRWRVSAVLPLEAPHGLG